MKTSRLKSGFGFYLAFALLLALSAWLRTPGFTQGGFANHDVGGIMYNGMLLAAGKLPYVDSVEFKAPGTFYLAWGLGGGGRNIAQFQVWANLFALGTLGAIMLGTLRLWGPTAGLLAGLVYGLHDLVLDTMDANYVTWAQLPTVGSVLVALGSLRRSKTALWTFGLAGALACFAMLCKRPAGVALLVVLMIAFGSAWHQAGETSRAASAARRIFAVLLGACLPALPLVLHYAVAGELGGLWRGLVLNEWGWRYVAEGSIITTSDAPREAAFSAAYFLALPLALAAFSLGGLADPKQRPVILVLLGWSLFALASAAIGFRFYKGYYLAAAAPLSMLAAAPSGLFGRTGLRVWAVRAVAMVPALLLVCRQGLLIEAERKNRAQAHDLGGRAIAERVLQMTEPTDTIWVWGWHLWDVYSLTGRLSSTRFYKTMELTTSANDSTWRHPRSPLHFRDDLAAAELIAELEAHPPDYIVLGSAVPVREFTALRRFLHAHYNRDRGVRLNLVQFWVLRADREG